MKKNYLSFIFLICVLNFGFGQTTLIKEDIAIIGVNTDSEDFTFLLRTDITIGTQIYFSDNEVDASGTALFDTNEGIVLFTAANNYSCGEVIGFINNSSEFTNISGSLALANEGDEVLAFQGYDNTDDSWTTFLHANVDGAITLPVGFTALDIVDGSLDNREYNGSVNNPTWAELNDITNYNEGNNFGTVTLSTSSFTCIAPCTPTHTISSFTPSSGPIGTYVTINGSGFTPSSTVDFNGTTTTIISQTATELIVEVLSGTTTGAITITEAGCPLNSSSDFSIIDNTGTCNSSSITDIIISEVYDSNSGNNWYLELYNPTSTNIDLNATGTDYAIERYANIGGATPSRVIDLTGTINANSTFTINLGDSADSCTFSANLTIPGAGINENDEITLLKNGVLVDVVEAPNETGYSILRLNTATGPSNTFIAGDWSINSSESCTDIGSFVLPSPNIPVITSQPLISENCLNFTISISANPGNGGTLTYQWKYNDGSTANWLDVNALAFAPSIVTGETSNSLSINGFDLDSYHFYCEVTENSTCTTSSNAVTVSKTIATWNGTNWIWNDGTAIDTMPTTISSVIIDGDYDTAVGGVQTSFEACECIVNTGYELNIRNNTYVLVENDLTVNGNIVLETDGAFVQINDTATVGGDVLTDKTKISVEKETAPLASYLEYTYWSSPVTGELISDGLFEANPNRIFSFDGQNFRDSTQETNNNDAAVFGQDDIDDNANDWQFVNGATVMSPGIGYASTHDPLAFIGPNQYVYTFEGAFNNGVYNIPIYRNDVELNDNNWNFVGNPYPSAIDADLFLAANASIDQTIGATNGAIFFWSHNTVADGNTNGNENLNYSQSDYAIINGSGQTAGGDGIVPTRHIPSGQGFFISMDDGAPASVHSGTVMTTDIIFNNSMRVTGSNNQFFRTAEYNKLWLNLTSDNGVFNQVLIAYVNGATDGDDGMYYDAHKNLSSDLYSGIYTTLEPSNDKKFAIQGKDPNSLNIDEVIPLGFNTSIEEATLYTISIHTTEGDFMGENDIFIIDYDLNITHNLKISNYNFTSDKGEFNERFEIVFTPEALSINDNTITANDISITELSNGEIQIKVSKQYTIVHVDILDILGRQVYSLNGNGSTEVYDLSKLSKAAYIAKVTLSNGQVISKKAIKQR